jgi:hypothetical protein
MDHVVYLDAKAKEMEVLLSGEKTMLIRGATGRKMPYGRVSSGDVLYFTNNNAEGVVKAKAKAKRVINSEKMSKEESVAMVEEYQDKLQLTASQFKRWAGKRYLVLIEVEEAEQLKPFPIDKSEYGNMDDWLPVEDIQSVME